MNTPASNFRQVASLSTKAGKAKKLSSVYRLTITLLDTDPAIWPRIEVTLAAG